MRFTVTGEQRKNDFLRTVILLFLGYILLHWVSNGAMYFLNMTLTYDSVVHYYLGNPDEFSKPRSYEGMLEVAHFHLFAMGILLITLVHLMLFAPLSDRAKQMGIWLPFLFAVGNEGAGWLVRFAAPEFAYLKIVTFLGLELSLLWVMGVTMWSLATNRRGGYRVRTTSG
ncbi:hypothetical protein AN478_05450 [Thiohalorhabdus denitrificans]|uniref:Uncharacterized protein n=1 Tax=Thiohalorhabdus denitrificans TaxID=381306 RepID=A0A0P9CNE0_9GAMM|nr:hypothetical protein [Thiohalorhabdus denitrificans]KPV40618.1 hypothetical protein AN478_05450 [Thiohalorhabdus denitrificans]SCY49369.1 hypothetical protein SAMN05661077_2290 [Thiohalorhabdus denitrificans]